jgi:hypothetical protein
MRFSTSHVRLRVREEARQVAYLPAVACHFFWRSSMSFSTGKPPHASSYLLVSGHGSHISIVGLVLLEHFSPSLRVVPFLSTFQAPRE